jgi:DMSO reductase anchor subunit
MKERSLVFFTLFSQAAVGTFLATLVLQITHRFRPQTSSENAFAIFNLSTYLLMVCFALMGISLLISFTHLGAPWRAMRAIRNTNRSWLSREILFGLLFLAFTGLAVLSFLLPTLLSTSMLTSLAGGLICGLALIYSMARVYMQKTVPGWNTPHTLLTFCLTALSLGLLITALGLSLTVPTEDAWAQLTALQFGRAAALSLALQVALSVFQPRPLPENAVRPGQRRVSPSLSAHTGWRTLICLLAAISALLPALLAGSSWPFYLISLCLAFVGQSMARQQFYLSYWRLGI